MNKAIMINNKDKDVFSFNQKQLYTDIDYIVNNL